LAPEEAGTGIMRLLSYGTVLFLALQFGYSTHCRRSVLWGVAAAGALYALYGILVWLDGNTSVLWLAKWAYPDSLTSTFVNRNSYATYAGLGLCAALALIARGWKEGASAATHSCSPSPWPYRLRLRCCSLARAGAQSRR
jgi:hypothetical protein